MGRKMNTFLCAAVLAPVPLMTACGDTDVQKEQIRQELNRDGFAGATSLGEIVSSGDGAFEVTVGSILLNHCNLPIETAQVRMEHDEDSGAVLDVSGYQLVHNGVRIIVNKADEIKSLDIEAFNICFTSPEPTPTP